MQLNKVKFSIILLLINNIFTILCHGNKANDYNNGLRLKKKEVKSIDVNRKFVINHIPILPHYKSQHSIPRTRRGQSNYINTMALSSQSLSSHVRTKKNTHEVMKLPKISQKSTVHNSKIRMTRKNHQQHEKNIAASLGRVKLSNKFWKNKKSKKIMKKHKNPKRSRGEKSMESQLIKKKKCCDLHKHKSKIQRGIDLLKNLINENKCREKLLTVSKMRKVPKTDIKRDMDCIMDRWRLSNLIINPLPMIDASSVWENLYEYKKNKKRNINKYH